MAHATQLYGGSLTRADRLTWQCGTNWADPFGHDREWRHTIFRKYPTSFGKKLADDYAKMYESRGRKAANLHLLKIDESLKSTTLYLSTNDDALISKADGVAKRLSRMVVGKAVDQAIGALSHAAQVEGVAPPLTDLALGSIRRLTCPLWWRRQLRKKHRRALECVALQLNVVNRKQGLYVSDESLAGRISQKVRARELLAAMSAINECGEEYSLAELANCSISNPRNRRAELMARLAGFENYAREHGHVGEFYTITCPSRMHASLASTGDRNPKYDGTTPRKAQKYLCKLWACVRSKLKRDGISMYGFRIAEPQHDGTPHWHLLVFVEPEDRDRIRQIISNYSLKEDPDEPGADEHRFQAVAIDWLRGTATGYVAKYVSKNIDGFGIDQDCHGNDAGKSAIRVDAWASTLGIRQFQQIGGPPVTVWRELRRLRGPANKTREIEPARRAADDGDWAGYVQAQGGVTIPAKSRPIMLAYAWSDQPGRYGEPKGKIAFGIHAGMVTIQTRFHEWRIELRKDKCPIAALDHGEAACGTRSERRPARAEPGGACDATTTGSRGPRVKGCDLTQIGTGLSLEFEFCQ